MFYIGALLSIYSTPPFKIHPTTMHPSMKHFKFNNEYMEELLRVITHENKNCILTGDININLLKHAKSWQLSLIISSDILAT